MLFVKTLYLLIVISIHKSKQDTLNTAVPAHICNITSDFVPNLFTGLINEFKFKEINIAHEMIDRVMEDIVKLDEEFEEAVHMGYDFPYHQDILLGYSTHKEYDMHIPRLAYLTHSIRVEMNKTLKAIEFMTTDETSERLITIADLIKRKYFKQAADEIYQLESDSMIYTTIEIVYSGERTSHAIRKIMNFAYHLLESRNIGKIITIELAFFRELTIDSNAFYTYDMVLFAELIRFTIETLERNFAHRNDYEDLVLKLTYIRISFPNMIQKLVFEKFANENPKWCIRNGLWNESIFVDNFWYSNDRNKRIVYTWNEGIAQSVKQWILTFNHKKEAYEIKNYLYEEYMYSSENNNAYDINNRFLFTMKSEEVPRKGYWAIVPIDNNYFAIRNVNDNEYIYSREDLDFVADYSKRRVFGWRIQGQFNTGSYGSQFWTLNTC